MRLTKILSGFSAFSNKSTKVAPQWWPSGGGNGKDSLNVRILGRFRVCDDPFWTIQCNFVPYLESWESWLESFHRHPIWEQRVSCPCCRWKMSEIAFGRMKVSSSLYLLIPSSLGALLSRFSHYGIAALFVEKVRYYSISPRLFLKIYKQTNHCFSFIDICMYWIFDKSLVRFESRL